VSQTIHLYAQCWNEEFMLPYFFRHYDPIVDRYYLYDDGSTDETLMLLARHPKVEMRTFPRSDPESFALSEQRLSNACWKESRGSADWVIVTDIDEHLYHRNFRDYLGGMTAQGVTLVPALGFQMISERLPSADETLSETCTIGAAWKNMMKLSLFDPAEVQEICFSVGRHDAQPTGNTRAPAQDAMILLHYKYLGKDRTYERHRSLAAGLRPKDIRNGWGHKYVWTREQFDEDWKSVSRMAADISGIRDDPSPAYPAQRWWQAYR
jgi:Glycosyl transferase family 2